MISQVIYKIFPGMSECTSAVRKKILAPALDPDIDLWHDLEWLAKSFHSLDLPMAQARPVWKGR
jgi:hypothetical protein